MKVLWLTNTPCKGRTELNSNNVSGGWLDSLQHYIESKTQLQLTICFYWKQNIDVFEFNKTKYIPVFRKRKNIFKRISHRIFNHTDDNEELSKILTIINIENPDLIHIHGTEENFALIQQFIKIPVIVSIQGLVNPILKKIFSGIPEEIINKNETIINKVLNRGYVYNYKSLYHKAIREQKMLSLSKYIMGRTDWDRKITRLLSPKSRYLLGNEILRPTFYHSTWKPHYNREKVIVSTTLSGAIYKGLETIIETISILNNTTSLNFEWQVIGINRNDKITLLLEKWLNVNCDALNIIFLGSLQEKELVETLLSADLYVQVSHIENSPNSLCEAMLLGIPSIASFAGGTNSLLENNKDGILFQDGDPYSCAACILDLYLNKTFSIKLGQSARQRAIIRHDQTNIIKEIINNYTEIIKI